MKDQKYNVAKAWTTFILYSNDLGISNSAEGYVMAEMWLIFFENYI